MCCVRQVLNKHLIEFSTEFSWFRRTTMIVKAVEYRPTQREFTRRGDFVLPPSSLHSFVSSFVFLKQTLSTLWKLQICFDHADYHHHGSTHETSSSYTSERMFDRSNIHCLLLKNGVTRLIRPPFASLRPDSLSQVTPELGTSNANRFGYHFSRHHPSHDHVTTN